MAKSFSKKLKSTQTNDFKIEVLESRLLFSADVPFAASALALSDSAADEFDRLDNSLELLLDDNSSEQHSRHALYVVDTSIDNHLGLIDSLNLSSSDQLVLVDQSTSGLQAVTDALERLESISELHIFSHGSSEGFQLGSDNIDNASTTDQQDEFSRWNQYLGENADLLLYGCDLASHSQGERLMQTIAELTGADVAASADLTGSDELGGNWNLEFRTGEIEARSIDQEFITRAWNGLLANLVVTTPTDKVDGDTTNVSSLLGNPGTDTQISLREAIIAANNTPGADTIILGVDTYLITQPATGSDLELDGDFDISDHLTIKGDSQSTTIISGGNTERLFEITFGNVTFEDLTLRDGRGNNVGGGAIAVAAGHTTLNNVTVESNTVQGTNVVGGGILVSGSSELMISNSTFTANHGPSWGGGIFSDAGTTVTITDSVFTQNTSVENGAGVHADGMLEVTQSTFSQNRADGSGGAIMVSNNSTSSLYDNDFVNNKARSGGAITVLGAAEIEGGYFNGNEAIDPNGLVDFDNIGGAITNYGDLIISDSTFFESTAYYGGAIYTDSSSGATIANSTFTKNSAVHTGGAIVAAPGTTEIDHSTFTDNSAGNTSGALYGQTNSSIVLTNSLFLNNTATNFDPIANRNFSAGFNAFDGAVSAGTHSTDILNANNNLGALADNGGLVPTQELLANSDAIDSGSGSFHIDATGQASNEMPDIGAFEHRQSAATTKVFWVDADLKTVFRANSTGGTSATLFGVQQIVSTVYNPWDIEYDTINQRLIWTENDGAAKGRIMQSAIDGSGLVELANSTTDPEIYAPRGLAIDVDAANPGASRLYITRDTGGVIGALDGVLEYQLNSNSINFLNTLFTGSFLTTPDMSDARDLELISSPSSSKEWLIWSEHSFSGSAQTNTAALTYLELGSANPPFQAHTTYTTLPTSGSGGGTYEFRAEGLAWDEANGRIHMTSQFGHTYSLFDINTGALTGAPQGSVPTTASSSGIELDPNSDRLYISQYQGASPADRHIKTTDNDHQTTASALNGLTNPRMLALASASATPEPPEITNNDTLVLDEGSNLAINSQLLLTSDADTSAANLVYTLESTPDTNVGSLELGSTNPTTLTQGSTFTQQDINNLQLIYRHNGSEKFTDSFEFSVSDGTVEIENQIFQIQINALNENLPVAGIATITLDEDDIATSAVNAVIGSFVNLGGISSDADLGDTLTYSLFSGPTTGTAVVNPDGTFQYDFFEALEASTDSFQYKVQDSAGQFAIGTIAVNINPINDSAPIAQPDSISLNEGSTYDSVQQGNFSLLANDTDADLPNDTLTASYTASSATAPQYGTVSVNADGTFIYTHDGSENLLDNFTYTISDDANRLSTAVVTLNILGVNDNMPEAKNGTIKLDEDQIATTLLDSSNIPFNNLSGISGDADTTDILTYSLVSGPSVGTAVVNSNGTFQYDFDETTETFTDSFVYKIEDSGLQSATGTINITINPINDNTPVAQPESISLFEGATFDSSLMGNYSVLDNDSDADLPNDALTTSLVVTGPATPEYGTLNLNSDGTFVYTHDGSENFLDTFTYQVTDQANQSTTATVTINIQAVNENTPVAWNGIMRLNEDQVSSSAADALGNPFTNLSAIASDADQGDTLTYSLINLPSFGTAVVNPNGTFQYDFDETREPANDSFMYMVQDSNMQTATGRIFVTVDPVNDNIPVAQPDSINLMEGATFDSSLMGNFSVLDNDSDVDFPDDALSASLVVSSPASPLHGTLILNSDGTLVYTHDGSENFTDSFTYQVSDQANQSTTETVTINIQPVNDNAPIAWNGMITLDEDQVATSAVDASNNPFSNLLAITNDADLNDNLTYSLLSTPTVGTAIVNANGTFQYDFDETTETFTDSFDYQVEDNSGQTATAIMYVTINPVNDNAPVAQPDFFSLIEGTTLDSVLAGNLSLLSNDTDADLPNDSLVAAYIPTITTTPNYGTVTVNPDGTFLYSHDGSEIPTDTFTYEITDQANQTSTATVALSIQPVNDNAPVVPDDTITLNEGGSANQFDGPNPRVTLIDGWTDADLGDAVNVIQTPVLAPSNGTLTITGNTFTYQHDGSETTADQFVYEVEDLAGNKSAVTVNINVLPVNENPPSVPDDTITLVEGGIANQFDGPNPRLTLIDGWTDADSGDSVSVNPAPLVAPTNGTLTLSGNAFSYQHDGSETTTDQFVYEVVDLGGNKTPVTVNIVIQPVNEPPVSQSSSISLPEDTTHTVTLANVGYQDPNENHPMQSLTVDLLPQNGALLLAGNNISQGQVIPVADISAGLLTYSPAPGTSGNALDTFQLRVTDTGGTANGGIDTSLVPTTLTFSVVPVNDAPSGANGSVTVIEDTRYTFNTGDFPFSDVSDNHSFYGIILDTQTATGSVELNGQAVATGTFITAADIASGNLSYLPAANTAGTAITMMSYRVVDSGGTSNGGADTSSASYQNVFDIAPINDPPQAVNPVADLAVDEGQQLQHIIPGNVFSDIEDPTLVPVLSSGSSAALPPWISFNSATGELQANPGYSDAGVYPLILTVTDSAGAQASTAFNLTVDNINRDPTGIQPDEIFVDEHTSNALLASINVLDPDTNDSHTVTVNDPRFLVSNGELWLLNGEELDYETESQINLSLTVNDGTSTVELPFTVHVNDLNDVPVATPQPVTEFTDAPYTFEIPQNLFVDEDDDNLTFTATLGDGSPLPDWIVINLQDGEISFTEAAPAGSNVTIVINADDGKGGQANAALQFLIEPEVAAANPLDNMDDLIDTEVDESVLQVAEIDAPEEETDAAEESTEAETSSPVINEVATDGLDLESTIIDADAGIEIFTELFEATSAAPVEFNTWSPEKAKTTNDERSRPLAHRFSVPQSDSMPLSTLFKPTSIDHLRMPGTMLKNLDLQREALKDSQVSIGVVTQTTATVGAGVSVGYVIWLLRSGVVLGSMLSALPAWKSIDPLPILDSLEGSDDEDSESLESMVSETPDHSKNTADAANDGKPWYRVNLTKG